MKTSRPSAPSWGPVTPKAESKQRQEVPQTGIDSGVGEAGKANGGRFQKGKSGNLKGRPPGRERTYTERQFARDFLSEFNRPMTVGGARVAIGVFAIRQLLRAAAGGDFAAQKAVLQNYDRSLKIIGVVAPDYIETLNHHEEVAAKIGDEDSDRNLARVMNDMRRKSRKL